jgi:hypothetical protein
MTDAQLDDLRRRIDAGEPVTNDELIAGLNAIRQVRLNAPTAKEKKSVAVPEIKIDLKALLNKRQTNPT